MAFEKNMNRSDQIIRFAMGAGMISMVWLAPESGYWGLLGIMPLASAIFRYCPTYRLLGVSSSSEKRAPVRVESRAQR